jgi:Ca2+/Na+ antiporter
MLLLFIYIYKMDNLSYVISGMILINVIFLFFLAGFSNKYAIQDTDIVSKLSPNDPNIALLNEEISHHKSVCAFASLMIFLWFFIFIYLRAFYKIGFITQ